MANNGTLNGHKDSSLKCIVCASATIEQFLDLGQTALANKFLAQEELTGQEPTYPLCVGFCHTCGHIQLTVIVPPSAMFEDYLYISSASDTLKDHLYDLSNICVERYRLRATDLVIDIGCNDGTLLSGFRRHGVRTLGVDPATNLAALTRDAGIERYVGFFNSMTAKQIREKWGLASLITATNTFPHIPELQDFVEGIKLALAPGGVFVIEAHYLVDILEQGAFDTIYHEHVSYWALGPMSRLFAQHGMEIVRAERLPIHHGQIRVAVQRQGEGQVHPSVGELLNLERTLGVSEFATFQKFARQTLQLKEDLQRTLRDLQDQGRRVVGYGAPAKGSTLLSFLEITPDLMGYIVDRSPLKQGRYTPGTHIPVVSPQRLLTDQPDYVVLLAWNFVDEILAQQNEYRSRGGKFIVPVPHVQIV